MTYKEVFQLAQDKGYNLFSGEPKNEGQYFEYEINYTEACLIQKWLRDEHKITINVFPYDAEDFNAHVWGVNVIRLEWGDDKECHVEKMIRDYPKTYEQALLKGVAEALNLIPNIDATNIKEVDKAYAKWEKLSELSDNEFKQKKADAAYRALEKMFPSKDAFIQYWNSKTLSIIKKKI